MTIIFAFFDKIYIIFSIILDFNQHALLIFKVGSVIFMIYSAIFAIYSYSCRISSAAGDVFLTTFPIFFMIEYT